eukprot:m.238774 g.238774  ORF g.238774 m.238774 type:complete len:1476 (+) comp40171_c0_seq3:577-5004(+)
MSDSGPEITELEDIGRADRGRSEEPAQRPAKRLTVAEDKTVYKEEKDELSYKCLTVSQWIVRFLVFVLVLGFLVASRVSFAVMVEQFNFSSQAKTDSKDYTSEGIFWLLLFVILVPYMFNFLRCLWCGLCSKARKNYPWPTGPSIALGFFVSVMESLAVVVFVYGLAPLMTSSALVIAVSCGVFLATIISQLKALFQRGRSRADYERIAEYERYHTRKNFQDTRSARKPLIRGGHVQGQDSTSVASSEVSGFSKTKRPGRLRRAFEKFLASRRTKIIATIIALLLELAGIILLPVDLIKLQTKFVNNNHIPSLVILVVVLIVLSVVWCAPIQKFLNHPQSLPVTDDRPVASARWKAGILNGLWRCIFTPVFAVITVKVVGDLNGQVVDFGHLLDGLYSIKGKWEYIGPFLVNIGCSLGAYLIAWLACTMKMHKAGFFFPLLLSTPLSVIFVILPCLVDGLLQDKIIDKNYLVCNKFVYLTLVVGLVLWLAQFICCLFHVYRTKLIALIKEEELFIQSYYNGPFLEQCLMLNRKTEMDDSELIDPGEYSRQATVFICTTMYRESLKEQRKLLQSLHQIANEQPLLPKRKRRHFESHIFFDSGANGQNPTRFALQFMSLLEESFSVDPEKFEKYETEYGLRLCWKHPAGMPFILHLKDPNKYKKKKRWSQVMYMSYILDYRCDIDDTLDDDNTFILTTDADVGFSRQAVEILIDRLARDRQVGAVCGRTHPVGDGPVVWYQKFDYAIGHWFQKVAEHVLGSVMCCPGCFSIFRIRALRSVLTDYGGKVEEGMDFLKKDMGEDRWLCTLMVYAGWRLEYAAAADCTTFCPVEFDEFYKQRRRWMPSTMANLCELCARGTNVIKSNDAVSILFISYQAAMIFSTIINPGTVILIMAAGLQYAFSSSDSLSIFYTFLVIFILISLFFGLVSVYCRDDTKLWVAKVLTFLFALIMAAVIVGVAVQVVVGLQNEPPTETPLQIIPPRPTPHHTKAPSFALVEARTTPSNSSHHSDLSRVPISTWYLAGLIAMFLVTALLHPLEMSCVLHGIWYLFCLPSGYVLLIVYSVCNLNNRSWGTREGKSVSHDGYTLKQIFQMGFAMIKDAFDCCWCCKETLTDMAVQKQEKHDEEGENDVEPPQDDELDEFEEEEGVESIEMFLDSVDLANEYAKIFKQHGYDDTSFLINIDDEELKRIGVEKRGHRQRILGRLSVLPETPLAPRVPKEVTEWLKSLRLSRYKQAFESSGYAKENDVQSLLTLNSQILKGEMKITKKGHVKKLMAGIKRIQYPSNVDKRVEEVYRWYSDKQFIEEEPKEKTFWKNLKETRLAPEPEIYGQVGELKEKLDQLRNYWILIFLVVNTIWIVLIVLLESHPLLKVHGTNVLGLAFLAVYGFILVIQFLTCIWHRLETMVHYLARRPPNTVNKINPAMQGEDVDMLNDADEVKDYFPESEDEEGFDNSDSYPPRKVEMSRLLPTVNGTKNK